MLVSSQKNLSHINFKSSFVKLLKTGITEQDSIVKKVALTIINLLLLPFRATYATYCKLFKVKIEPKTGLLNNFFDTKTLKELITKHKPTIIKTALIGIGISCLIAFGYKPSKQISNMELLAEFISSNKLLSFSASLGLAISSIIFIKRDSAKIELNKIISSNISSKELNKIINSKECRDAFGQILNSKSLSSCQKLNFIKAQLQTEIEHIKNMKNSTLQVEPGFSMESTDSIISFVEGTRKSFIAHAQIHFADVLIDSLITRFSPDPESYPKIVALPKKELSFLNSVKESIDSVKNKESLDLAEKSSEINEILKGLKEVINIESLSLERKGLMAVLPCIGEFTSLNGLYLGNNELTFIPESIDRLIHLKHLNLNNNKLTFIPESIGNLIGLQYLYLHKNKLTFIPEFLGKLTNLQQLFLDENTIDFPKSIGNLEMLEMNEAGVSGIYKPPVDSLLII